MRSQSAGMSARRSAATALKPASDASGDPAMSQSAQRSSRCYGKGAIIPIVRRNHNVEIRAYLQMYQRICLKRCTGWHLG